MTRVMNYKLYDSPARLDRKYMTEAFNFVFFCFQAPSFEAPAPSEFSKTISTSKLVCQNSYNTTGNETYLDIGAKLFPEAEPFYRCAYEVTTTKLCSDECNG